MQETVSGSVATAQGAAYVRRLAKHFAHKAQVDGPMEDRDAARAEVAFPFARCRLEGDGAGLRCALEGADAEGLARGRDVIDRHLATFAHREGIEGLAWG